MRPISESNGYIDITKGTSEDFNKLIKSFGVDITDAFNATNRNETMIKHNMDIVIQEMLFLQRKVKQLEEKTKSVLAAVEKIKGNSNYYKIIKSMATTDNIDSISAYHDLSYGVITLPYENSQKASLNQYPREFLLKNIDILIEYNTVDVNDVVGPTQIINLDNDADLINILDQNENTFWMTNIEVNNTIKRIDFKVTINLPLKIMTNLFVNSVGIKPHPIYSLSLKSISYIDANNKSKNLLPGYPVNGEAPKTYEEIENLRFMFPTIATTKLEFEMAQSCYVKIGDKRNFVLGFKGIDIENISITSESETFVTRLVIPGENKYFLKVLEPTVYPIVEGMNYGNLVTHELLYDKNSEATFMFGSEIGANLDTVYIRTTIKRDGEVIPAIKGIEFNYLPK